MASTINPRRRLTEIYGELTGVDNGTTIGADPAMSEAFGYDPNAGLRTQPIGQPITVVQPGRAPMVGGITDPRMFVPSQAPQMMPQGIPNTPNVAPMEPPMEELPAQAPINAKSGLVDFLTGPKLGYTLGQVAYALNPESWGGRLGLVGSQLNEAEEYQNQLRRVMAGGQMTNTFLRPELQQQVEVEAQRRRAADLAAKQARQEIQYYPEKTQSNIDYINELTASSQRGRFQPISGTNFFFNPVTREVLQVDELPSYAQRLSDELGVQKEVIKTRAEYEAPREIQYEAMGEGGPLRVSELVHPTRGREPLGEVPLSSLTGGAGGGMPSYKKITGDERESKMERLKKEMQQYPDKGKFLPKTGILGTRNVKGALKNPSALMKSKEFQNAPADFQQLVREYNFLDKQMDVEGYLADYAEFDPYFTTAYESLKAYNETTDQKIPLEGQQGYLNVLRQLNVMRGQM